jgi:very-short-patch-repair endonuclease
VIRSLSDLLPEVMAALELDRKLDPHVEGINEARDSKSRWNALREFYKVATPEILKRPAHEWALDPYAADWMRVFTPIEYGLWCDIRTLGLVFYPQYPVGRYFVDFANPVAKVALECDGRAWHQDAAKDRARQDDIEALGWTVYRFTGRACLEPDEIEEDGEYVPNPSRAKSELRDIANRHGLTKRERG